MPTPPPPGHHRTVRKLLTQASLTTAAVLWLITGALAYRAARRRDFARHRAWMTRNYALTFPGRHRADPVSTPDRSGNGRRK